MSTDDFGSVRNQMLDAAIRGLELTMQRQKVGVGRPAKCPLKRARTRAKQLARRYGLQHRILHLIRQMEFDD